MKLILKLYLSLNKTSVALASLFTCKAPDGAVASVMECMASTKYIKAELLLTLSDAKFYSICYDRSSGMSCHPTKPPPPFWSNKFIKPPPLTCLHDCCYQCIFLLYISGHKFIYSACELWEKHYPVKKNDNLR